MRTLAEHLEEVTHVEQMIVNVERRIRDGDITTDSLHMVLKLHADYARLMVEPIAEDEEE